MSLQIDYDCLLNERVNGADSQEQVKELLLPRNVLIGLKAMAKEYNQRITKTNERVNKNNLATYNAWEKVELTAEQAEDCM